MFCEKLRRQPLVNDPLPNQLTAGELRKLLRDSPDSAVVALKLPPSPRGEHQLSVLCNLTVERTSDSVVLFSPDSNSDVHVVPGSSDRFDRIPDSLKSAFYWFVSDLTKGLLEDDRWDFDSDWFSTERLDWDRYAASMVDPTVMCTVISIWTNNLAANESDVISNPAYAQFRAAQYLRTQFDDNYTYDMIEPPFAAWELREWQTEDAEPLRI